MPGHADRRQRSNGGFRQAFGSNGIDGASDDSIDGGTAVSVGSLTVEGCNLEIKGGDGGKGNSLEMLEGYNATAHTVTRTISLTVNKADPTVTAPKAKTLTYSGNALSLVEAGTVTGGTMQYSLNGNTFSKTIPSGTDAETYTVYYKVVGDANYNNVEAMTISATISKAVITPTVKLNGWIMGKSANVPVVTGNTGDGKVNFTYAVKGSSEFSDAVPTNVGKYTVKASIAETTNYLGGEATANFAITSDVIVWDMEDLKDISISTGEQFACYGVTLVSVDGEASFNSSGAVFNGYNAKEITASDSRRTGP